MGYTSTKENLSFYLKFKLNWAPCILSDNLGWRQTLPVRRDNMALDLQSQKPRHRLREYRWTSSIGQIRKSL